jgi:hypothetical protein
MKPYGRIKTNAYFVHCGCGDCENDRKTIQRNTARARRLNKTAIEEGLNDMSKEDAPNFRRTYNCTRCKFYREDAWGSDFGCYCKKESFHGKLSVRELVVSICDLFEVSDE